jgi:hypothetical protein
MDPVDCVINAASPAGESLRAEAFAAAGVSPPTTREEARKLTTNCVERAKKKAQAYAKASLGEVTEQEALDWVAMVSLFRTWADVIQFVFQTSFMTVEDWLCDKRTYLLLIASWQLRPEHESGEFVRAILGMHRQAFKDHRFPDYEKALLRRVMYAPRQYAETERIGYSPKELRTMFFDHFGWSPARLLLSMLDRTPVVNGMRAPWPALNNLTPAQLLDMPLANSDTAVGFGYRGWEHAVPSMLTFMEDWARMPIDPISRDLAEQVKRKRLAASADTRMACREMLDQVLRSQDDVSVLKFLLREEGLHGFFGEPRLGSPEHIEATCYPPLYEPDFFDRRTSTKRLAFRQPFEGYQLSMWRAVERQDLEKELGRIHTVDVVLHNDQDELVAALSLSLVCLDDSGGLTDFVWQADATSRSDLLEVAAAVALGASEGNFADEEWRRLLFISNWQVRKQDRGHGLGVKLLKETLRTAFRGLPGPRCVAVSLEPMQFVCPPLQGGACESIPEFKDPKQELLAYWEREVIAAGILPASAKHVLHVPYAPPFHAQEHLFELFGLGALTTLAKDYDGDFVS